MSGGQKSWGKSPGEIVLVGNCPGGTCPWGNYSGAVFWGIKLRGGIFLWGISWGAVVQEGIVIEPFHIVVTNKRKY